MTAPDHLLVFVGIVRPLSATSAGIVQVSRHLHEVPACRRAGPGFELAAGLPARGMSATNGQAHRESAATAFDRRIGHVAAVSARDLSDDRKPETGAL